MRLSKILHLDSYRERKETRLRQTLALYRQDRERSGVLLHLWRAVSLAGGDRGAVVWVDEYGPGLAHAHVLLDLAFDRPRRLFSPVPLREAWNSGVPALLDLPDALGRLGREGEGIRSLCAVALGSDGPRSWFLVVDSLTPRAPLTPGLSGDLMFLAGEVASVVLHRDLDWPEAEEDEEEARSPESTHGEPFAGWPVLRDIEERRDDEEANRRISVRFLLARLLRGMVEEELVLDAESLAYQIRGVRGELGALPGDDPERKSWDRVLAAVELLEPDELLAALLEWGTLVEDMGHLHGAREIHALAYDLAVSGRAMDAAVDAARFQARICRKLAEWNPAVRWYGVARDLAEETGNTGKQAAVLDGLANTYRDKGNFPKARELLQEVLALGHRTGDRYAGAIAHHDLMVLEVWAGDLEAAILHGWEAFKGYEARRDALRALFDLAGVLLKSGELTAAEDAYSVAMRQLEGFEHQVMALDAMAYLEALRGRKARYLDFRSRVDGLGWERLAPVYQSQILYYRGLSCRALGWEAEGRKWLQRALTYAETHGLSKFVFDAEAALGTAPAGSTPPAAEDPLGDGILDVRLGLRDLRETLAGAESL